MQTATAVCGGANLKLLPLRGGAFGPREVEQMVGALSEDPLAHRMLREATGEMEMSEDRSPAAEVRLGVCYYLLGRYHQAIETLRKGDGGALALFYLAKSQYALEMYDAAVASFQAAAKAGYDSDVCSLARAEALRVSGNGKAALEALDGLSGAVEQSAEYLYQRGATVSALCGNPAEVVAL